MSNFLLIYHGGGRPDDPAEQAKAMQAWTDWFAKLGPALVDGGNPASETREIDSAVALAKGCPILPDGGSLQVVETPDMM
jgi:hypothetical protein